MIRRERGGPVVYRTEPMYGDDWCALPPEAYTHESPTWIGSPMLAHDALYNHFQAEKYSGASRSAASRPSLPVLQCCVGA